MARDVFERGTRINLHRDLIKMDLAEDGALILIGVVDNNAVKKVAMSLVIGIPGTIGIVDRLHPKPAERMVEGVILDRVCNILIKEPAFHNWSIRL